MNKGTVNLDLKEYNELRDFRKEIIAGNTCRIGGGLDYTITFIGTDEALGEMESHIRSLEKQIVELKRSAKPKEPTIGEIKAMNWMQFRKWKKTGVYK